jgi:hypothetical protein
MSGAKQLAIPTVHLNGTSRDELERQLHDAYAAAGVFMEVLRETSPNARDYYVQDDGAFRIAQAQYVERLTKLESIRGDMLAIYEGMEQS